MAEKSKNNRDAAAFVVLSVALAAPVMADAPVVMQLPDPQIHVVEPLICRYAGPPTPLVRYDVIDTNPLVIPDQTMVNVNSQVNVADTNINVNNASLENVNNNLNVVNPVNPVNNVNVYEFGAVQLAPGHFIFK